MSLTIDTLKAFYETPRGQLVRRAIQRLIVRAWKDVPSTCMLGLGYTLPYLSLLSSQHSIVGMMPYEQGACAWPSAELNRIVLMDDGQLPLGSESIGGAFMVHAFEVCDNPKALLRELWRILTPQGRALIIVPNLWGAWAHLGGTVLGYGQPWSASRLTQLLENHYFSVKTIHRFLYTPPIESQLVLQQQKWIEKVGFELFYKFSGLIAVEITKESMAMIPAKEKTVRAMSLLQEVKKA